MHAKDDDDAFGKLAYPFANERGFRKAFRFFCLVAVMMDISLDSQESAGVPGCRPASQVGVTVQNVSLDVHADDGPFEDGAVDRQAVGSGTTSQETRARMIQEVVLSLRQGDSNELAM